MGTQKNRHQKHMLKLKYKKILIFLRLQILLPCKFLIHMVKWFSDVVSFYLPFKPLSFKVVYFHYMFDQVFVIY